LSEHVRHRRQVLDQDAFDVNYRSNRRRFFDQTLGVTLVRVFQGDFYATSNPNEALTTTLGSCVAVCMRDPVICFGGMNHFVLPNPGGEEGETVSLQMRYGSYAIERLINLILSEGGRRERLETKVFGGANMLGAGSPIGHHNANFVERYLKQEGLPVVAQQLRGSSARRVRYWPATGRAQLKVVESSSGIEVFETEANLQSKPPRSGKVELFR
jgi:chemotaxis protein CheD